ncbi:hypothetical protein GCM10011534_42970 [Pseudooceanicola nanhaiensis]|jgi:alkylation response protein AidB-like acyl-CoA dehydrogenase|uniref:Acyl-CoA dehydrogenase/oxidase N-terminal domain-containing protein n=1 Tax=Pseudooceanicola nanhaiensis TaxID=375761 RepID=A0A917TBA3_9RHOB|nr:acyl-CoA dehydrogenase family protein [Pseudooceanicola nanhaiensis]GGM16456.1 hypothetical protein GCM10011534_42970 [Pseudooceanicola nanhaiensis]
MVDLVPNEDEQQVIDSIDAWLAAELPLDRLRVPGGAMTEATRWTEMADLGWFALGIPEVVGGVGLSVVEETMLLRACGRTLTMPSMVATVLSGHVAARARKKDVNRR